MSTLYALLYVKKVFGKSCYRIKVYNEILEMIDVHWFPVCILSDLSINNVFSYCYFCNGLYMK
jgi:hypothetical protein